MERDLFLSHLSAQRELGSRLVRYFEFDCTDTLVHFKVVKLFEFHLDSWFLSSHFLNDFAEPSKGEISFVPLSDTLFDSLSMDNSPNETDLVYSPTELCDAGF
jgi:hypothetical protein